MNTFLPRSTFLLHPLPGGLTARRFFGQPPKPSHFFIDDDEELRRFLQLKPPEYSSDEEEDNPRAEKDDPGAPLPEEDLIYLPPRKSEEEVRSKDGRWIYIDRRDQRRYIKHYHYPKRSGGFAIYGLNVIGGAAATKCLDWVIDPYQKSAENKPKVNGKQTKGNGKNGHNGKNNGVGNGGGGGGGNGGGVNNGGSHGGGSDTTVDAVLKAALG